MHIQSCLNPKVIYNKYLGEKQIVPCGRCAACLNMKASVMVDRLEIESTCWQYTAFFTLTYSPEKLPLLRLQDHMLLDNNPKRVHPILGMKLVNLTDEFDSLHLRKSERHDVYTYIKERSRDYGGVPYLSSLDVQRFMKRVRKWIHTNFPKKNEAYNNEKDIPKVRYYICGEYGPTTHRPHYHGILFFTSNWLASNIHRMLGDCWRFGYFDCSFVEKSASSYVANYTNSVCDLPLLYQTLALRPFSLFSKHPALGTLVYNSETLRSMFLSETLTQVTFKQNLFDDVPLWTTMQNRLFPRIALYDFVSPSARCKLYGIYESFSRGTSFDRFDLFKSYVNKQRYKATWLDVYLCTLAKFKGDFDAKLQRLYLISKRVVLQAHAWNIPLDDYVKHIEGYYNKKDSTRLKTWYSFIEEYTLENPDDSGKFLGCDLLFLRDYQDLELYDLTYEEILIFESFGVDLHKFFSADLTERENYQKLFLPENSCDYMLFKERNENIAKSRVKTKKKNDYDENSDSYAKLLLGHLAPSPSHDLPFTRADFKSSKF